MLGLGTQFQQKLIFQINSLKNNPQRYSVRYARIHCMVLKGFPFMVHYSINDKEFQVDISQYCIQVEILKYGS